MAVTLIRATVLYAIIIFLIRLMGKRQIGELQPSELVITMLLSEIASIPMQDNTIPIVNSIVALFVLVAFEILTSAAGLKSYRLRSFLQGHPVIVIRDGKIDMKALKKLRMTVNDLLTALREKDVFEISQVSFEATCSRKAQNSLRTLPAGEAQYTTNPPHRACESPSPSR